MKRGRSGSTDQDSLPSADASKAGSALGTFGRIFGWRARALFVALIVVAGLAAFFWQDVKTTGQTINDFLGIGIPIGLLILASYAFAVRRWGRRALRLSHRWLGALTVTTGILALLAFLEVEGTLGVFPLQTELGVAIVRGATWLAVLKLLGFIPLSLALFVPRVSLRLSRSASIVGARGGAVGAAATGRFAREQAQNIAENRRRRAAEKAEAVDAQSILMLPETTAPALDDEESFDIGGGIISGDDIVDDEIVETANEVDEIRDDDEEEDALLAEDDEAEVDAPLETAFPGGLSGRWQLPSLTELQQGNWDNGETEELRERGELIVETLMDYGIEAEIGDIRPGPAVTQYGVHPRWQLRYRENVERDDSGEPLRDEDGRPVVKRDEISRSRLKVDRIASLDKELSLVLKAPIRIETSMPTTGMVGIEVPNPTSATITLRAAMETDPFPAQAARNKLAIPIGIGAGGESVVGDLAKMPHLLIAGSTGSGKSVFINSLLSSLLLQTSPQDVRMILVDPKRVELSRYEDIPHLLSPVLTEPDSVVNALKWTLGQMSERLDLLAEARARDIDSYNRNRKEKLPYLIVIIDELADLMITSAKAVEQGLVRLAQMGRATGIHLVVATQRPSVDVVTGLIKANFPTRISFAVSSSVDSRTILDMGGAEKLLGKGDLFFMSQETSRPMRVQGAFVGDDEVERLVSLWRQQAGDYKPAPLPDMDTLDGGGVSEVSSGTSRKEPLLEQAYELASLHGGRVSTSLLQRKLGIGYPRAARLKDILLEEGVIASE